jgi:maltooligosyltrehalose trehalohydrolase
MSAKHFLLELKEKVDEFSKQDGRKRYLIAESDLNDVRIINPVEKGGYNPDVQWSDDFHHSVHSYLTGERNGYYQDFGNVSHIKKALKETFVYSGNYSEFRKRKHGNSAKEKEPFRFVVCIQNHDQVGNRGFGERLSYLVEFEKLKLASGLMILSPCIPLLFMGEEYAEESPFLYFVSHIDQNFVEAVRKGRKEEFKSFNWEEDIPAPQSEETFFRSKLNWELHEEVRNKILFNFYKKLLN